MKKILAGLMMIPLFFTACNSNDVSTPKGKEKYERTKESLAETEKNNPRQFLSVNSRDRRNLIGKTVINVTISSRATVASYKDVNIELSFFSKTGAILERDNEVIYETVAPGGSIEYKKKYKAPKGTDSVALKILGAKTE